ncbi:2612_t:CDS:1, partial [Gigaspora rosea]
DDNSTGKNTNYATPVRQTRPNRQAKTTRDPPNNDFDTTNAIEQQYYEQGHQR